MTDGRPWADWDHVLKLDPDKDLPAGETFADVCATGTDAILVGGTTGMTEENVSAMVDACAAHDVPLFQEPSTPDVVIDDPGLDGYLVPTVLNARDGFWITGAHKEWARIAEIDWDRTWTEGYVVLNPDATVADYTDADCDQTAADVAAYARIAERFFGQEIVYAEYSGTLGDPDVVAAAHDALDDATLFYGGGIGDRGAAERMAAVADVVIVGDLVHDEGCDAVRQTVDGARAAVPAGE